MESSISCLLHIPHACPCIAVHHMGRPNEYLLTVDHGAFLWSNCIYSQTPEIFSFFPDILNSFTDTNFDILQTKSRTQPNKNLSNNLLYQELKNHIRYIIKWDSLDQQQFDEADEEDPTQGPRIGTSKIWSICIARLHRLKQSRPPKSTGSGRSRHLFASETLPLGLIGPSGRHALPSGELTKLRTYFKQYREVVDRSDSEQSTASQDLQDQTVNIRKITASVLSWYGCTSNTHIFRPSSSFSHCQKNTRDASHVQYLLIDDNSVQSQAYAKIHNIISLKFAGRLHALAYVQWLNINYEKPGLCILKPSNAAFGKFIFIKINQLQELVGLINKDGKKYIIKSRTAFLQY